MDPLCKSMLKSYKKAKPGYVNGPSNENEITAYFAYHNNIRNLKTYLLELWLGLTMNSLKL